MEEGVMWWITLAFAQPALALIRMTSAFTNQKKLASIDGVQTLTPSLRDSLELLSWTGGKERWLSIQLPLLRIRRPGEFNREITDQLCARRDIYAVTYQDVNGLCLEVLQCRARETDYGEEVDENAAEREQRATAELERQAGEQ